MPYSLYSQTPTQPGILLLLWPTWICLCLSIQGALLPSDTELFHQIQSQLERAGLQRWQIHLLPCCFSQDKTWWWTPCPCSLLAVSSLFVALLHLCSFISKDWSQQRVSVSNENRVRLGFHFYLKSEASLLQIIRSLELWNHKRHRPLANLGEHSFPVTKRRGVSKRNRISSDPHLGFLHAFWGD